MKLTRQTIGAVLIAGTLAMGTGCDTTTGALSGAAVGGVLGNVIGGATGNRALGTVVGVAGGAVIGGVIGNINEEQRRKLQQQSPQTLQTLQHNDQVAKQQQAAPPPAAGQPPPPPAEAPVPLKVDDVKAMSAAGIKPQAIIDAIKESKTVYSPADIDAAQQANPPVDATVIAFMKNPTV